MSIHDQPDRELLARTSMAPKMRDLGVAGILALLPVPVPLTAASADEIRLRLPVRCELGVTCFVQNYLDHDPSGNARDYQCGGRTYDGHTGTDIRLLDLEWQRRGVEVLASAAGSVTAVRDGVDDVSVRTVGKAAIAGKECGNGVVIAHASGWQTQYCHMAKGSVRVQVGARVAPGDALGLVGMSGDTEFPHLHLTVRFQNGIVDPFAFEAKADECGAGHSIWDESIRGQITYKPREVLNYGFTALPPTMEMVESGQLLQHPVKSSSDALVAYVRAIGLKAGDEQSITLLGPDGLMFAEYKAPALERDKAQYFVAAGKKRKGPAWTPGAYTANYLVRRNGEDLVHKTFGIKIGPE